MAHGTLAFLAGGAMFGLVASGALPIFAIDGVH